MNERLSGSQSCQGHQRIAVGLLDGAHVAQWLTLAQDDTNAHAVGSRVDVAATQIAQRR